ncbi:sel1 repeat family protein [Caulobacter mirabilis]|uniref:Sel1 repeat family protein n=1 Tax=Caulobacter mirabilis TaxID=69666 RepID=A0A2D2AUC9_9CAUL|nr:sel1 repeat family protein [Caulobacter mirabilis]ATQ41622.1 hypothetical protein CSW64_03935 [Caulobacter mirabilis]
MAASDLEDAGDLDGAITLYRRAAILGDRTAQMNLGVILSRPGSPHEAEGLRWSYRATRSGEAAPAWNLAMHHRMRGNRRRYFHWLKVAADRGDEEAITFQRVIADIRRRGGRAPMLFLEEIDTSVVGMMLDAFLKGEEDAASLQKWAEAIVRGEAALGPPRSRLIAEVVDEMALTRPRMTKRRARELIFKLG